MIRSTHGKKYFLYFSDLLNAGSVAKVPRRPTPGEGHLRTVKHHLPRVPVVLDSPDSWYVYPAVYRQNELRIIAWGCTELATLATENPLIGHVRSAAILAKSYVIGIRLTWRTSYKIFTIPRTIRRVLVQRNAYLWLRNGHRWGIVCFDGLFVVRSLWIFSVGDSTLKGDSISASGFQSEIKSNIANEHSPCR